MCIRDRVCYAPVPEPLEEGDKLEIMEMKDEALFPPAGKNARISLSRNPMVLDVYKRQAFYSQPFKGTFHGLADCAGAGICEQRGRPGSCRAAEADSEFGRNNYFVPVGRQSFPQPVSYTHLDVYKRQE